jgi:hypothetical protein
MSLVTDARVRHYWDPQEVLGKSYQRTLPTPGTAWDVYLVFRRGVQWAQDTPPAPDFWMHQLSGVTNAPRLDPAVLREHVERLLH